MNTFFLNSCVAVIEILSSVQCVCFIFCAQDIIPFGNNVVFRHLFGWMVPPKVSLLKLTQTKAVAKLYENNHIIQDMLVPVTSLKDSIKEFDKEVGVSFSWASMAEQTDLFFAVLSVLLSLLFLDSSQILDDLNDWYKKFGDVKITDYRYECVSKKVRVGTGQYFKWIEGFATQKNVLESTHTCYQ